MAISIMQAFSSYTIETILNMPYCHFIKLYLMSEKAESFTTYTIMHGNAAIHNQKIIDDLNTIKNMAQFVQPKIVFPKREG